MGVDHWLGVYLYYGKNGSQPDPAAGLAWLQKAADAGHPRALRALADIQAADRSKSEETKELYEKAART